VKLTKGVAIEELCLSNAVPCRSWDEPKKDNGLINGLNDQTASVQGDSIVAYQLLTL